MPDRLVYGVQPILEALRARSDQVERVLIADGARLHALPKILDLARRGGVSVRRVPRARLDELSEGGVHQGVLAEMASFRYAELADLPARAAARGEPALLVVADGIQDPMNLGSLCRSAEAFGAHGLIIPQDRAAGVTPVVVKASAGAIEHLPVARVVNVARALGELKEAGLWICAVDHRAEKDAWEQDLSGPLALVVGGEGSGIRPNVRDKCDLAVRLPMRGKVASFNAAVAGALALYEVARQRRRKSS